MTGGGVVGQIIETRKLYKDTIKSVTQNEDNWLDFLKSAAWNFKYDFDDQILIYAQRPNARACAEMKIWNEKVHRWVNKGADKILVQSKDEDSPYPYKFVFDVSDTHNYKNTPYKLWELKPEYENEVIESLENKFGEVGNNEDIAQVLSAIANNIVMDNIQDYITLIEKYKSGSLLENMTKGKIESIFFSTLLSSVANMMMIRCNINPDKYINRSEYSYISKFNSSDIITILGTATSDMAETALREIATTVINLQNEEKRKIAHLLKIKK